MARRRPRARRSLAPPTSRGHFRRKPPRDGEQRPPRPGENGFRLDRRAQGGSRKEPGKRERACSGDVEQGRQPLRLRSAPADDLRVSRPGVRPDCRRRRPGVDDDHEPERSRAPAGDGNPARDRGLSGDDPVDRRRGRRRDRGLELGDRRGRRLAAQPRSRQSLVRGRLQGGLDFIFEPSGLLAWFVVSLALGALASFLPAVQASRCPVREALEYE